MIASLALFALAIPLSGALSQSGGAGAGAAAPRSPVSRGRVAVFVGMPGVPGELRVLDEIAGGDLGILPGFERVSLLPIDYVGRSRFHAFEPQWPRYRDDVPGAARLVLQAGRGCVYAYVRETGGGELRFGYLHVRPDGAPRALHELPGAGAAGDQNPWLARVGVAADGGALLAATTPAAGGDLVEIDVERATALVRTSHLPPLAFSDAALWLGDGWGFGAGDDGIWRFRRAPGALAAPVGFAPGEAPSWFSGEAVMSADRRRALTTAGTGPGEQWPFVFGPKQDALRAGGDDEGVPIDGAGFLPDAPAGPYMAVSDDGARASWRRTLPAAEGGFTAECFLAEVASAAQIPARQVTADEFFLDTLDQVGAWSFDPIGGLRVAIGSIGDADEGGIENADLFDVRLDAQGEPVFTNLTLSSGDASAPFLSPGTLEPTVLLSVPASGALFLHDHDSDRILGVHPGGSVLTLFADAKDVDFAEHVGGRIVFAARRESGDKPREIFAVDEDLTTPAVVLVPGDDDTDFLWPAVDPGGQLACVRRVNDFQDTVLRIDAAAGTFEAFPPAPSTFGAPLGFTERGALLLDQGALAAPSLLVVWPEVGPKIRLQAPPAPSFLLPAR